MGPGSGKNIRLIAFDLFGVIFTEGHLLSNVLSKLLAPRVDNKLLRKQYEDYNLGHISEKEFWGALGQHDEAKIRTEFLNSFVLDPDFRATVDTLKQHYRLSILSNLPADWADSLNHKYRFMRNFSPCVFSGHCGFKKPQPEIYQTLISLAGVSAPQVAFIDDRLENLQAAGELGFTTLYYEKEQDTHPYIADHKIHSLAQIVMPGL